jgi:hypothetical protein
VPVLFLIAIVVVLVGIFFAATGRGGELSYEPADHAPLDLGPVSAADVALLRPPTAMWGYNMQVTDAALDQIARAVRDRDVTIAYLQDQLAGYARHGSYADPLGAHARQASDAPEIPGADEPHGFAETPEFAGDHGFAGTPEFAGDHEFAGAAETRDTFGAQEPPDALEPSGSLESLESPQSPEDPEAIHSPEPPESLESPGMHEPLESPEPPAAAEPPATAEATASQTPGPPQTAMVLKASGLKPEPHEATQPSQTLQDPGEEHDTTEPAEVFRGDKEPGEATQPSATLASDEAPGPQGAYDTHDWWAEQQEAAREEQAHRQPPGEQNDDSMAAAEEQGS